MITEVEDVPRRKHEVEVFAYGNAVNVWLCRVVVAGANQVRKLMQRHKSATHLSDRGTLRDMHRREESQAFNGGLADLHAWVKPTLGQWP